jgi:hypothetical protein
MSSDRTIPSGGIWAQSGPDALLLSTIMSCSRYTNTYTIPFNPVHNESGECTTAKESFNHQCFVKKRGSRSTPYPTFVNIYRRSARTFVESNPFDDLFLADFVESNKRQEIIFGALWQHPNMFS